MSKLPSKLDLLQAMARRHLVRLVPVPKTVPATVPVEPKAAPIRPVGWNVPR